MRIRLRRLNCTPRAPSSASAAQRPPARLDCRLMCPTTTNSRGGPPELTPSALREGIEASVRKRQLPRPSLWPVGLRSVAAHPLRFAAFHSFPVLRLRLASFPVRRSILLLIGDTVLLTHSPSCQLDHALLSCAGIARHLQAEARTCCVREKSCRNAEFLPGSLAKRLIVSCACARTGLCIVTGERDTGAGVTTYIQTFRLVRPAPHVSP